MSRLTQQPAPLKIGMFHFTKIMTSTSTPVVLTLWPGRLMLSSPDAVLADLPAQEVSSRISRMLKINELHGPWGKWMLGGLGAAKSPSHTSGQIQEVQEAHEAAQSDPWASGLELSRVLWTGRTTTADGSYLSGIDSMVQGEAKIQPRLAPVVHEALLASGVRQA